MISQPKRGQEQIPTVLRILSQQSSKYRQTIIDYLYDKEAFSSRKWFSIDHGEVDWSDLPRFSYHRADISINIKHASGDIACLFLINVVLFMTTFLIFVRQEV